MTTVVEIAEQVETTEHVARAAGESRPIRYVVGAICVFVSAIMLAPIVFSFLASIKPAAEARESPPSYLPKGLSLENYLKVFDFQAGLWTYVSNSLWVASLTIVLCLALAIPAGYGLARFRIPYKEVWFLLLLAPLMIPYQALLTPLYLTFSKLGLANSHFGLAIVHTILQLPFSIYLMRNSFEGIPREIEEAAVVDGSTTFQALSQHLPAAGHAGHRHRGAVRLHQLLERVPVGADLHEQGNLVHRSDHAGERARRAPGRRRLGRAAGGRGHLDPALRHHLPAAAEVLRLGLPQRRGEVARHAHQGRPPPRPRAAPAGTGRPSATWRGWPECRSAPRRRRSTPAAGCAQETRDKVMAVAREIGYRPNDMAQSLHRTRSMTVGIISTDSFGRFTLPIVEGAGGAARRPRHRRVHVQRHRRSGRASASISTSCWASASTGSSSPPAAPTSARRSGRFRRGCR